MRDPGKLIGAHLPFSLNPRALRSYKPKKTQTKLKGTYNTLIPKPRTRNPKTPKPFDG